MPNGACIRPADGRRAAIIPSRKTVDCYPGQRRRIGGRVPSGTRRNPLNQSSLPLEYHHGSRLDQIPVLARKRAQSGCVRDIEGRGQISIQKTLALSAIERWKRTFMRLPVRVR
jgi:hypothetical protein